MICFCLFLAFAITFDDYVSKICYEGDGEYFAPQIARVLQEEGVEENRILKVDLRELENKLLLSVDNASFISLKKSGRILTIEAYRLEQKVEGIDLKKQKIVSTVNGKIRAINLLSGTALLSVGDEVKQGDTIIDGYYQKGEEKFQTYALGEVEIEVEYVFTYQSFASGERYKNRACVLASESLGDKDVIKQEVKEDSSSGKTIYTVTLYYIVTVS